MNKEKAIKLAKKLKALAERGIQEEKTNAQEKLDALLKKYELELHQITDGLKVFERTTLNEGSVILERIIKSVNPEAQITVKQLKTKLIIEVILSDIEYKEIRQKYKFFWRAYNRERKLLLTSFFNKHYSYFNPMPANKNNSPANSNNNPIPTGSRTDLSKSNSSRETSAQSAPPNTGGFRGRPLTLDETMKVRAMLSALSPLDYAKIPEMQENDSPSDVEYKDPSN